MAVGLGSAGGGQGIVPQLIGMLLASPPLGVTHLGSAIS